MKKGANNTQLGEYIRHKRAQQGLDIASCAEQSGFHDSYWRKLEAGHYESPDAKNLAVIAETLSCPLEDLYSLCGYALPTELPSFGPYLRATTDLSAADIAVMQRVFDSLARSDNGNQRRAA